MKVIKMIKQVTLLGGMILLIGLILLGVPAMAASGTTEVTGTVLAAPTVTSISPTSVPPGGGTSVTIIGTGFVSGATVTIGSNAATGVTLGSATSLTATTPAGPAGAQNVVVTNPDGRSGTLTDGFTYYAPASGGGGYVLPAPTGSVAPAPTGSVASVPSGSVEIPTNLTVNNSGNVTEISTNGQTGAIGEDSTALSQPGGVTLQITRGTVALNPDGSNVAEIYIHPTNNISQPAANTAILLAYDCGPEGTTFNPPVVLSIHYEQLPEGVNENSLYLALWNGTEWIQLESEIDTQSKTASASVHHFSQYALIMPTKSVEIVPTTPTNNNAQTTAVSTATTFNWVIITIIIVTLLAVLLFIVLFVRKKKRNS